jgi:hypothetical protein
VEDLYAKFGHSDRIAMREGYHQHQFSPENQEAAIAFMDHFNGLLAVRKTLAPVKELDEKTLQCTRTGQVMLDYDNARSLMDVIRDYYVEHKSRPAITLKHLYYSNLYPGILSWSVSKYQGAGPGPGEIRWEELGTSQAGELSIDRYLLHHSRYLELPLLYIHTAGRDRRPVLLWLGENGKVSAQDWPTVTKYLDEGYDIVSIDPRGLGETRMHYKAVSEDDPALAQMDFDHAYVSPVSGILADYVYNSLLTGRPYLLQMIEDVEIATRFVRARISAHPEFAITGEGDAYTLASTVSETLPGVKLLSPPDARVLKWSDLVNLKRELWPIEYLLPGGAYVH